MGGKGITGSFNVNSFNKIIHTTIQDDKNQVLRWLSSLEPQRRHRHIRESRLKGVGEWIFQTSQFRRWNTTEDGSSHSVLFCHGAPGVGKTHLSSLVIDHFYGNEQDFTVAGLYCDYLDREEQTTSNILGAMLKQLIGSGVVSEEIRKSFEVAKRHFGGVHPEIPELLNMLKTAIGKRGRVVICIDGLDECLASHRTGLLSALQAIFRESPNVRLFLAGRPFIRHEVERYFPSVDTILVSPTREDTEAFLRIKLDGDPEPDAMDESLRANIMEIIPKKISEIFLLVSLSIEAILGETTIRRRREKLKQMSSGQDVGDVYNATFERIKGQKKDRARLGMEAIMWIAYSERPLGPDQLCQALGVKTGSVDLDNNNAPSIRTILNCALGLVTVDSSSSEVRLVHFTLQEHILANPALFCDPHSMIAEVCLTYLNFGCIKDLSPTLCPLPPTARFLEYASCYWGAHARRQTSANVISLALKLLDGFNEHISCELLLRAYDWGVDDCDGPMKYTALHVGALLGVPEIMVSLLKINKWALNATNGHGSTALMLATMMGHDAIVKVLLEQEGIDPNIVDRMGTTPLAMAAADGHEGIVEKLLVRSDVHPNMVDGDGRTPPAEGGEGEIVRMLLERGDVNPDTPDGDGRTPLSFAAECGRGGIVRMLLKRNDANPDTTDDGGRTPLSLAAESGQGEIVRMLLQRDDVNPDSADKSGRTPLSWAAERRREENVQMLLERNDVNPHSVDKSGRQPLSWAAKSGHGGIFKLLFEQSDVNPDTTDEDGRTPLSWAAESGQGEIVRMLLQRNDVNPDSADKSGRTPLSWAAGPGYVSEESDEGNRGVVKILLERNDVNPDSADKSGRAPLSWATWNGLWGIVRTLLERNDVNPNTTDEDGRTPLSWAASTWVPLRAAKGGRRNAIKMLLERNGVNPDRADKGGRTPLSLAAECGHEDIVQMLLERNDVNHDAVDKDGRTPLSWAVGQGDWLPDVEEGCEKIAKMLLEWNDVNPNRADNSGRTPLSWATENGSEKIMRMLFERHGAHLNPEDESGETPFPWAAEDGDEESVGMLLNQSYFSHGTSDEIGQIPFSSVAMLGREEIVDMLPERNNVNPNRAGESAQTQFRWPTENDCERVVYEQDEWHDLDAILRLREELFWPFATQLSCRLEPPLKKIRQF